MDDAATSRPKSTSPTSLPTVQRLLDGRVNRGADTGTTGFVSIDGDQYDIEIGENGAGAPMTSETVVPWTCASKPIGALAFAQLWDVGLVGLDDAVQRYLPDYGRAGKEKVTIRNLLTHTTGVPDEEIVIEAAVNPASCWSELDDRLWQSICASAVERADSVMTYNMIANWFVLDRVLMTITGSSSGEGHRAILDACGASGSTLGLNANLAAEERAHMYAAKPKEAVEVTFLEPLVRFPIPGMGVWGPIRSLARVGSVLLNEGMAGERQIVRAPTVAALTATQLPGPESFVDSVVPYGFGIVTAPGVFGRECSHRAFGHPGGNTSMVLVDPEHRLVAAFYWNGRVSAAECVARHHATIRALYRDLALKAPPHRA